MNNIIREIFEFYDYQPIGSDSINLYKSTKMEDYWLLVQGTPEDFNYESQSDLLSKCKAICNDASLDKNINLLCLWGVDTINPNVTTRLHHLEEDLYFFKKHVFYYTNEEFESFKEYLKASDLDQILTKDLIDSSVFTEYKLNQGLWQSLLYRLVIKLTFMPVVKGTAGDLSELYETHKEKISKHQKLSLLDELIDQMSQEKLQMEPEDLVSYIEQSMEGQSNV